MKTDVLDRDWKMFVCKDGTVTITGPGGEKPIEAALPFFSVHTEDEATELRTILCKQARGIHPDLPQGEPWYFVPGFEETVEAIGELSERAAQLHEEYVLDEERAEYY